MSAATQPVLPSTPTEANYLDRMTSMTRAQLVATQREIAELEVALVSRRAQLSLVLQTAAVLRIEFLPAAGASAGLDATTPSTLAGANGVGQSRGGI